MEEYLWVAHLANDPLRAPEVDEVVQESRRRIHVQAGLCELSLTMLKHAKTISSVHCAGAFFAQSLFTWLWI